MLLFAELEEDLRAVLRTLVETGDYWAMLDDDTRKRVMRLFLKFEEAVT